ncbi:MAG: glycerophosphodiester phosphodiesterase family protein [Patescibacteria group bacterium]|nr:glycerophosphodiester phosphodiesterase family protein [Patescibacteria group bacterium]
MPTRFVQENTLLSFLQAIQAGADGIEFDLRVSKDGELVVGHDKDLSRIAGIPLSMNKLTVKELRALSLRGAGQILTFNEITESIPSPVQLDVEVKDVNAVPALITKLRTSTQLRERTIISSFDCKVLEELQKELPDVRRLLLLHTWSVLRGSKDFWKNILALKPWAVGARGGSLTKKRMEWLRANNVLVAAYDKANSNMATKRIVNKGVDVAITYRPHVARKMLAIIKN